MYTHITENSIKDYTITTPGKHIFYFENISAELSFTIATEQADVEIYGLYRGKETDQFTVTIAQIHTAPRAKSFALIKSVLKDSAQLQVCGKIHVEKDATETTADFKNKNILLSPSAHMISMPQLEIAPHDVHCTHTSQTTPLDYDQLEYLMSRGITLPNAHDLLIEGFLKDIVQYKK